MQQRSTHFLLLLILALGSQLLLIHSSAEALPVWFNDSEKLTVSSPNGSRKLNVLVPSTAITAAEIGVVVNTNDPQSVAVADYFITKRNIPLKNRIEVSFETHDSITFEKLNPIRSAVEERLSPDIQAIVLTFTRPYWLDTPINGDQFSCVSITAVFSQGLDRCVYDYKKYYRQRSTKPFRDFKYRPTMMLAGRSFDEVKKLIDRGIQADGTFPRGKGYLMLSDDRVRSALVASQWMKDIKPEFETLIPIFRGFTDYWNREDALSLSMIDNHTGTGGAVIDQHDVLYYVVGSPWHYGFWQSTLIPGSFAYNPTSWAGALLHAEDAGQTSALKWLDDGATASYGTVWEPFADPVKFPNMNEWMPSYFSGRTIVEAISQSVAQETQGLLIGDPLARPYGPARLSLSDEGKLEIATTLLDPGLEYELLGSDSENGTYSVIQPSIKVDKWKFVKLSLDPATKPFYKLAVTKDILAPEVSVEALKPGQIVNSEVPISIQSWDNVGVSSYAAEVDGISLPVSSQSLSTFIWNTWKSTIGPHEVAIHALDAAGNVGTSKVVLVVERVQDLIAPTVSIISPQNGETVHGKISVRVNADDNVGVTRARLGIDGVLVATNTEAPFGFNLDTAVLANGNHTLKVIVNDAQNTAARQEISINVQNTIPPEDPLTPDISATPQPTPVVVPDTVAPSVKVTSSKAGDLITVRTDDDHKVAKVEAFINGQPQISTTILPAKKKVVIKKAAIRSTLEVSATDDAGNKKTITIKLSKLVGKLPAKSSITIKVKNS